MGWTLWALLLVTHGAFSRWARSAPRHALMATLSDALLLIIGLLTLDKLQGLGVADIGRVGAFFVAFAVAGQQMMKGILRSDRAGATRA